MKKIYLIVLLALILTGCSTTNLSNESNITTNSETSYTTTEVDKILTGTIEKLNFD